MLCAQGEKPSVPFALSEATLVRLCEFVEQRLGLHFPRDRWHEVERGIRGAALQLGLDSAESLARWSTREPTRTEVEVLASHLTVGETYFFRERQTLDAFETRSLPELIADRRKGERRLRVWSAGCCTGEEPYSIAILLHRLLPDLRDWNVTILATDINPLFLRKAAEGVYGEWSFRSLPAEFKAAHFARRSKGRYAIRSDFKRLVTFEYLNLVDDVYPSLLNNTNAMDVIFCRNVLMYFAPERARGVIGRFHESLLEGGWLIVSPIEGSLLNDSPFAAARMGDTMLYRKDSKAPRRSRVEWQPPAPAVLERPARTLPTEIPLMPMSPDRIGVSSTLPPIELPTEGALGADSISASRERAGGEDPESLAQRARVCANEGALTEAFDWCEQAIALERLNPGLYYLRAMILQELDRTNEAVASLKRALFLDQDFALAHFVLGSLVQKRGKAREADRHFANALALLSNCAPDFVLPESDGLTASRMADIIRSRTLEASVA